MSKTRTHWGTWTFLGSLGVFLLTIGASLGANVGSLVNADGTYPDQIHACVDNSSGRLVIVGDGEFCNENWSGISRARSGPGDGPNAGRLPKPESSEFTDVDSGQEGSLSSFGKSRRNFTRDFGRNARIIPFAKDGSRGADGGKCQAEGKRKYRGQNQEKCRDGDRDGDGDGDGDGDRDRNGGGGEPPGSGNDFWALAGNTDTNPLTDFLGTTGDQPFIFKINGSEVFRVGADGNVGIGTETPSDSPHVSNGIILLDGGGYNFAPAGERIADLGFFRGGIPTDGLFIVKRRGPDHTIFHINSPPEALGANEATLSLVRGDEPNLELVDFYNNGYPTETQ